MNHDELIVLVRRIDKRISRLFESQDAKSPEMNEPWSRTAAESTRQAFHEIGEFLSGDFRNGSSAVDILLVTFNKSRSVYNVSVTWRPWNQCEAVQHTVEESGKDLVTAWRKTKRAMGEIDKDNLPF